MQAKPCLSVVILQTPRRFLFSITRGSPTCAHYPLMYSARPGPHTTSVANNMNCEPIVFARAVSPLHRRVRVPQLRARARGGSRPTASGPNMGRWRMWQCLAVFVLCRLGALVALLVPQETERFRLQPITMAKGVRVRSLKYHFST
jgi:hypothetical protein